jgi:hypothetical protein
MAVTAEQIAAIITRYLSRKQYTAALNVGTTGYENFKKALNYFEDICGGFVPVAAIGSDTGAQYEPEFDVLCNLLDATVQLKFNSSNAKEVTDCVFDAMQAEVNWQRLKKTLPRQESSGKQVSYDSLWNELLEYTNKCLNEYESSDLITADRINAVHKLKQDIEILTQSKVKFVNDPPLQLGLLVDCLDKATIEAYQDDLQYYQSTKKSRNIEKSRFQEIIDDIRRKAIVGLLAMGAMTLEHDVTFHENSSIYYYEKWVRNRVYVLKGQLMQLQEFKPIEINIGSELREIINIIDTAFTAYLNKPMVRESFLQLYVDISKIFNTMNLWLKNYGSSMQKDDIQQNPSRQAFINMARVIKDRINDFKQVLELSKELKDDPKAGFEMNRFYILLDQNLNRQLNEKIGGGALTEENVFSRTKLEINRVGDICGAVNIKNYSWEIDQGNKHKLIVTLEVFKDIRKTGDSKLIALVINFDAKYKFINIENYAPIDKWTVVTKGVTPQPAVTRQQVVGAGKVMAGDTTAATNRSGDISPQQQDALQQLRSELDKFYSFEEYGSTPMNFLGLFAKSKQVKIETSE